MTLFRSMGRHRYRSPEAAEFAAYLRGTRKPPAEPMPPRPPECREPAVQQPEWWGRTAADDPPLDPCGGGTLKSTGGQT